MDGQRFITSLHLKNLLSYGPNSEKIDLLPLNVLIGANASGKSNFIETIKLLRATATDLSAPIFAGGGIDDFLYKGVGNVTAADISMDVALDDGKAINHSLSLVSINQRMQLNDESIKNLFTEISLDNPEYYYNHDRGNSYIYRRQLTTLYKGNGVIEADSPSWQKKSLDVEADRSILSQRTDPDDYPVLNALAHKYQQIKIYKNFVLEGSDSVRWPQRPDLPNDFLDESGRNLSLIINDLAYRGALRSIIEKLQTVYEDVEDITAKIEGGTVQTYIRERGMREPTPAGRLSDGTLRFLCLLVILYHPTPPPLICIEEPELGMHPDVIPAIAEMLFEASSRTQLIVTTHSDLLISKLGDIPEAVVVCERTDQGSSLRRLEKEKLNVWLENYSLGDLWLRGEIGGTRW